MDASDTHHHDKTLRFFHYFLELRFWVLIIALLQPFFSCGLIYGWAGLLLVIKGENTYAYLCDASESKIVTESGIVECIELDSYLNYISSFVVASQMIFALVGGFFTDLIGPKFVAIAQAFITLGTAMMAMATPGPDKVDILLIGIILQNCLGLVVAPSLMHYAYLYPKAFYFICATMSSSIGISSIIFPIINVIWTYTNWTRSTIFWFYTGIVGFFLLFSLIQPSTKLKMGGTLSFRWKTMTIQVHLPSPISPVVTTNSADSIPRSENCQSDITEFISPIAIQSIQSNTKTPLSSFEDVNKNTVPSLDMDNLNAQSKPRKKFMIQFISLLKNIKLHLGIIFKSKYFVFYLIYSILWSYIFLFYLTSVNLQLSFMTETEAQINYYTEIFSWLAPVGICGSLTAALLLQKWGYKYAIIFQLFLGLLHIGVNLTMTLSIQFITFLTYTLSNEALFGILFSFITQFFPIDTICTLIGMVLTLQGCAMLTVSTIVTAILENNMNFYVVNIPFVLFGLLSIFVPFYLQWKLSYITDSFKFS